MNATMHRNFWPADDAGVRLYLLHESPRHSSENRRLGFGPAVRVRDFRVENRCGANCLPESRRRCHQALELRLCRLSLRLWRLGETRIAARILRLRSLTHSHLTCGFLLR